MPLNSRFWAIIFLSAAFFFSGCTKKKKSYDFDPKNTLFSRLGAEPPSLDWHKSSDTTSAEVIMNMMEGLVEYNLSDPELSLKPALAVKWRAENKAQRWIFTLREGVKWTDGKSFTAQQVVDGWERLLNPATASEYAYFLFGVKNAKAYNSGKIKDFSQVGVHVNSQGELVVDLEAPQSYFPYLLAHHSTYPIRKDVVKKFGDQWTNPRNIQTLGAYRLVKWDHDKAIVLKANKDFYGGEPPIKNVVLHIVKDAQAALNLFDTHKIDILDSLPSVELKHLRKRPEYRTVPLLGIYYFGLNVKKKPTDNVLVRKALSMAIDRKEITDMLGGGQVPMTSWVPKGMFGYMPDKGLKFNVKKARELLDKAGYKDRSRFPTLKLLFNTNEDHQRVAENIQAQLKRNLGINVELGNAEWKVYLSALKSNNTPHIFRMGWIADFPDPDNFLNLMTSYSANNHTNWSNKEFDRLILKAATVTDKKERLRLYGKAQEILVEKEVPVIPIYSYVSTQLVSKRVLGYASNAMGIKKYKEMRLQ
ncbi:MAG: peptide ABC transporter substrate-binding protein [Bdellovibrio sp.]|nr:MAG: peptide ABC transporter substrate-binding protein [Bdellovibrio sp.]